MVKVSALPPPPGSIGSNDLIPPCCTEGLQSKVQFIALTYYKLGTTNLNRLGLRIRFIGSSWLAAGTDIQAHAQRSSVGSLV